MIRGIILEGISCSGKTSVLRSLKCRLAKKSEFERSNLILSEHYTQVLQRVNGNYVRYSRDEHIEILRQRVKTLEELSEFSLGLGHASLRSRGMFFVLERFHLNHRNAFPKEETSEIEDIESRLHDLNATCVLLTISKAKIISRLESRGEIDECQSKEGCRISILKDYLAKQDGLLDLALGSKVPTLTINTDGRDWDLCAEEIVNHLKNGPTSRI